MTGPGKPTGEPPAPVWGRDDLTCPLPARTVRQVLRHAFAQPADGVGDLVAAGQHDAGAQQTLLAAAVQFLLHLLEYLLDARLDEAGQGLA